MASPVLMIDGYVRASRSAAADDAPASAAHWRIRRWTESRGWRVGRILDDAPGSSSGLQEALARVESRESDGIVVLGLHQLADALDDVLAAVERIQAAGGTFASVREGLDLTTPAGAQMLRLLLMMRQW